MNSGVLTSLLLWFNLIHVAQFLFLNSPFTNTGELSSNLQPLKEWKRPRKLQTLQKGILPLVIVPSFMFRTYIHFARNPHIKPVADTIRSFTQRDEDVMSVNETNIDVSVSFDVEGMPKSEKVVSVELRIQHIGVQKDDVFPRNAAVYWDFEQSRETIIRQDPLKKTMKGQLIGSKGVFRRHDDWLVVNIMNDYELWRRKFSKDFLWRLRVISEAVGKESVSKDRQVFNNNSMKLNIFLVIYSRTYEAEQVSLSPSDSTAFYRVSTSDHAQGNSWITRRFRRRKEPCSRTPMFLYFKDIGWDKWVIAPEGFHAYQCKGKCFYSQGQRVFQNKHSTLQTLLHLNKPHLARRACCVPTKLGAISILYIDNYGIVTYRYRFEGVVVSECGCS